MRKSPIAISGVSKYVKPAKHMAVQLWWDATEGINWQLGVKCTLLQLEEAIEKSALQRLPSDLLPSLAPGDVVELADGLFWINANWEICSMDITATQAIEIALNDCASHFTGWKLVDVQILRCERVADHWEIDVQHVYSHGDCVIFPCELSLDGSTNSYSFDFVDLPPGFTHLEPIEK